MEIKFKNGQQEDIRGLTSEYPYICHNVDYNVWSVPWHWHEEVEFNYVVAGKMKVKTTQKEYIFEAGEALFINRNVLSTMGKVEGEPQSKIESHLFHPVFLSGHFHSIFETKYIDPIIHNRNLDILEIRGTTDNQKEILRRLRIASSLQKEENSEFQIRNIFSEIWLLLLEEMKATDYPVKRESQNRIQTMLMYIHEHYDERILLEDIAGSASVGTRECLRCFQKNIQRSPLEYLLEYRMEQAKKLLGSTENTIIEVALACGFSNSAYFCKIFKEQLGLTPGEYRKRKG